MADQKSSLPLYEKVYHKNTTQRALDVTILLLLLCLLFYRFLSFKNHEFAWFLAFLCESCFTFIWVTTLNCKWNPMTYKTYPQRLQERTQELPPVDMFVTTADDELEPPIITVNTVLSLLAVEYPAHKLACYVSDDGCSPLTFYSLVEASKFAKLWVPFCKKYNVQVRAPFRYFPVSDSAEPPSANSWEFKQDWKSMKLQFRQCLAYLWILTWGLRSIPELCYAALPAYCIITNSTFLPKVQEPAICIPVAICVIYKMETLSEYIHLGLPIYSWWVNNCMSRIAATSAWLFGVVNTVFKLLGLSESVFEITQKFHQSSTYSDGGKDDEKLMVFDESHFFVPGTVILLIHVAALATALLGLQLHAGQGSGPGEYICSVYVVLCFLPFLQGLFRKGKHGIPLSTICKSAVLALIFLQSCKMSSMN